MIVKLFIFISILSLIAGNVTILLGDLFFGGFIFGMLIMWFTDLLGDI